MGRDSFVFYRSFFEATKTLPKETRADFYDAVAEYALNGNEYDGGDGFVAAIFAIAKPIIEANNKKYENGKRGGRPNNQTITKEKPSDNQTITKEKPNTEKRKPNVNDNVNVNVNANVNVNDNVNAEKETAQAAPAPMSAQKSDPKKRAYGEFKNVMLAESERQRLNERLGEQCASEYIERLGEYLKSKGKRYSSHYATILAWHRRDGTKNQDPQSGGQALDKNEQAGFGVFWEAYPKHSGIDDAKREWAVLAPDDALCEKILQAVAWRKGTEPWKEQQGKFIPAPAKWLHDHGWTDYHPPQRADAPYIGLERRDPNVAGDWDEIMGEQIKAIRGY